MSALETTEIRALPVGGRRDAAQWLPRSRRLVALGVFVGCSIVLGVAAVLTPSASGIGSHEQLGLPACGWIAIADMPCPTCGMTTAFAHAADGQVLAAVRAQPLGGLLALAVAMTWLVCIQIMMTGSRIGGVFARLWSLKTAWAIAGLVVLAWGYKIALHKGWLS
jgi:hypothetical protein